MKLLFDQQLSPHLVGRLLDLFPGSMHVQHVGLDTATDQAVWAHARREVLTIVSKDADFADLATLWGAPPRVILLQLGNCTTADVETLMRTEQAAIAALHDDAQIALLRLG